MRPFPQDQPTTEGPLGFPLTDRHTIALESPAFRAKGSLSLEPARSRCRPSSGESALEAAVCSFPWLRPASKKAHCGPLFLNVQKT